jgi:hypothetical protein
LNPPGVGLVPFSAFKAPAFDQTLPPRQGWCWTPGPQGRGSLAFCGLDQPGLTISATTDRRVAAAGVSNTLFDLTHATGVHVEVGGDSVHKLAASKTAMNLDRVFKGEAPAWPPRAVDAHSWGLAVSEPLERGVPTG